MKISKNCINTAYTTLKYFSREELEKYVLDVLKKTKEYDDSMSFDSMKKAIKDINNKTLQSIFEEVSIKSNNLAKFEKYSEKIKSKKVNLRTILVKRNSNLGDNVASAQKSAATRLYQFFFKDLSFEEVELISSGKNDVEIAKSYSGKSIDNPMVSKLAKKIESYFEYRNSEMILSNALHPSQINGDRMFRQIHDQGRMISGRQSLIDSAKNLFRKKYDIKQSRKKWVEFIKKYLDIEKTFSETNAIDKDGIVNESEIDKILEDIFDNISTGKSSIFTRSTVVNDAESIKKRSRMFFVFKNMESFIEYNKAYGRQTLFEALMADIQHSGSQIGLAEKMGGNPFDMYNDLAKIQLKYATRDPFWFRNTENYFKVVRGMDKSISSPSFANFFGNMRTLTSMARLPKVVLQSLSDIAYISSFSQRMGLNYFKSYLYHIKNIFDLYPNEERKYIANLMKLSVDSHLGFMGRWVDTNNTSEFMNKISTRYFKFIGLNAFDKGNKIGIMHLMSKHLFNNSSKTYEKLSPSLKKWVDKFLEPEEWELLRKKNNGSLFTTENVENVSEEELKKLHIVTNQKIPLYQYKNDLFTKVFSMFDVASENAVLSPGEFERAWLFQGEPPDTIKGVLLRTVSQFKMYSVSYIDRVLVNGLKDSDTKQQKLAWATSMLVGTLPLSILSIALDNWSNGLSMPDWDLMNLPERERFFVNLTAPSLSVFMGLLDPRNQNSNMALSLISSPTIRLISYAMAAAMGGVFGADLGKAEKYSGQAAKYLLPIDNVPFISPFIRQAMGDEAYLQPGQEHLFGQ